MLIIKREETLIPQTPDGKQFADEYEKRLHKQGALRGRVEDSQWIRLSAEFYFNMVEGE